MVFGDFLVPATLPLVLVDFTAVLRTTTFTFGLTFDLAALSLALAFGLATLDLATLGLATLGLALALGKADLMAA